MSELDDFLTAMLDRQIAAETAIHNGEVEPRMALWSRSDPVTLLGAMGMSNVGWDAVSQTFLSMMSRPSPAEREQRRRNPASVPCRRGEALPFLKAGRLASLRLPRRP